MFAMTLKDSAIATLNQAMVDAEGWFAVKTKLAELTPDDGDPDEYRPLDSAFAYMLVHDEERQVEEGVFAPMFSAPDVGQYPPPLSELEEQDVDVWADAVEQIDAPVGLARLHDLLWERRHGDRPDLHARAAVYAYLVVSKYESWPAIERTWCLTRALQLATSVKDLDRIEEVVRRAVEVAREDLAVDDGGPGIAFGLLAPLAQLQEPPPALDELIEAADAKHGNDPHIAEAIFDLKAARQPDEAEALRRGQVERWREVAGKATGMLRSLHLQRALEVAKTHGLSDLLDEIRVELRNMTPEDFDLKSVSVDIPVPDELDSFLDQLVGQDSWDRALVRLIHGGPPGGEPEHLDKHIADLRQAAPLQFLVTRVVLSADETTAIFRATDEESHQRLARSEQRAQRAKLMGAMVIGPALMRIPEKYGPIESQRLAEFFTSDMIDAATAERIAAAVELLWAGKPDEAAHLIVPRLESVLREFARRLGIPIVVEPSGPKPGHVKSLSPILDQLRPAFAQRGWHAYVENVLADPLGLNLRNAIAHGLRDRIDEVDAALLIHVACFLRSLELRRRETSVDTD
jgi:hypothetical protein